MKKRIMFSAVVMMSLALVGCNQEKQTAVGEISTNELSTNEVSTNEVSSQEESNQLPSEPVGDYLKNAMNKTAQIKGYLIEYSYVVNGSNMEAVLNVDSTGAMYIKQSEQALVSDNESGEGVNANGEMYITAPDSDGNYDMYANMPEIKEGWTKMTFNNTEDSLEDETVLNAIQQTISENVVTGEIEYGAEDKDFVIVSGRIAQPTTIGDKTELIPCHVTYQINKTNGLLEKVEIVSFDETTCSYTFIITEDKDLITIPKEVVDKAVVY